MFRMEQAHHMTVIIQLNQVKKDIFMILWVGIKSSPLFTATKSIMPFLIKLEHTPLNTILMEDLGLNFPRLTKENLNIIRLMNQYLQEQITYLKVGITFMNLKFIVQAIILLEISMLNFGRCGNYMIYATAVKVKDIKIVHVLIVTAKELPPARVHIVVKMERFVPAVAIPQ